MRRRAGRHRAGVILGTRRRATHIFFIQTGVAAQARARRAGGRTVRWRQGGEKRVGKAREMAGRRQQHRKWPQADWQIARQSLNIGHRTARREARLHPPLPYTNVLPMTTSDDIAATYPRQPAEDDIHQARALPGLGRGFHRPCAGITCTPAVGHGIEPGELRQIDVIGQALAGAKKNRLLLDYLPDERR